MDNVVVSMREVVGRVTSNDIDPGVYHRVCGRGGTNSKIL